MRLVHDKIYFKMIPDSKMLILLCSWRGQFNHRISVLIFAISGGAIKPHLRLSRPGDRARLYDFLRSGPVEGVHRIKFGYVAPVNSLATVQRVRADVKKTCRVYATVSIVQFIESMLFFYLHLLQSKR